MSLRGPSQVSATTGRDQVKSWLLPTAYSTVAAWTAPTLWVLVIITGPPRRPDSSTQVVPVISPLPFRVNHAAKTERSSFLPRGRMAVTPVRTGPCPGTSFPAPRIRVVRPTSTPATSVMALSGPGVPAWGVASSRGRGGAEVAGPGPGLGGRGEGSGREGERDQSAHGGLRYRVGGMLVKTRGRGGRGGRGAGDSEGGTLVDSK